MKTIQWSLKITMICILLSIGAAASLNVDHQKQANYQPNIDALKSIAMSISDKIKHIIILMEENRSFDHMFGFYGKGTNGLTGNEYNLVDTADTASERIYVDNKAPYINQCDPVHGLNPTTEKIYGNLSYAEACNFTCENMGGFVQYENKQGHGHSLNYCNVMESLNNAEKLPVITALADEFVLMDRFFCSVPGPTWPNRLFHLSGTSAGDTSTGPWYRNVPGNLYPQKTIFDQVNEVNGTWKLYYNDTPWEMMMASLAHSPENMATMDTFFSDCANGKLPDYAFINPRAGINVTTGIGANDQHPDHDIRAGEQYYKDIYEALRASPQWNETLFILTYDEHGGFHDHVLPTLNVPIPDNEKSYPANFKFDRLGIRIPTLLISPWVPKGMVVSRAPEAQRPFPNSEYDLTSIMASARKILGKLQGVGPLTNRDAWASTFEHVLDILPEARTDCPMHLPSPEPPQPESLIDEARQPINDLQADILHTYHVLAHPHKKEARPSHIVEQSQLSEYLQETFAIHRERTLRWKASKLGGEGSPIAHTKVQYGPYSLPNVIAYTWAIRRNADDTYYTLSTNISSPQAAEVCLDAPSLTPGAEAVISICYPSADPDTNRDVAQQWLYGPDTTIRPRKNTSLCLTTDTYLNKTDSVFGGAYLAECDPDNVRQRHGYDGAAPGATAPSNALWCGGSYMIVTRT